VTEDTVSGDDFALVVASENDWVWDVDAVVAAIADNWPRAKVHDGHPVAGGTYRTCIDLPEAGGRGIQVAVNDSGTMISLQ
jgi:hypothetical protein